MVIVIGPQLLLLSLLLCLVVYGICHIKPVSNDIQYLPAKYYVGEAAHDGGVEAVLGGQTGDIGVGYTLGAYYQGASL